jgi:hypothetical protein
MNQLNDERQESQFHVATSHTHPNIEKLMEKKVTSLLLAFLSFKAKLSPKKFYYYFSLE